MPTINTHAADFERDSSQYASIADASQTGLDLADDFTIEFWVRVEQLSGLEMVVVGKYDSSTPAQKGYCCAFGGSNKFHCFFNDASGNQTRFDTGVWASNRVGRWVHVAVAVDISVPSAAYYENGVSATISTITSNATSINNNAEPFMIGSRGPVLDTYFDGQLDDVRVWSDIRTAAEIAQNYDIELVGNEANLVGYWKLNNNWNDETANNNDLTASGSPTFITSPLAFADPPSLTMFKIT